MVSIVIPTYQEGEYLEMTLRHLKSTLTGIEHEVIVSDSGSNDGTVAIAQKYADRVVEMKSGRERSIAQGRNDGAMAAHGDFLIFIDADVMIPDTARFIRHMYAYFARDPKRVAMTTRIEVDPPRAHMSDRMVYALLNSYFAVMDNLFNAGMAGGEFQMIRTAAFRSVGGFNESLKATEDMDLFNRLSKIGRARFSWKLVVYHSGRRFRKVGAWRTMFQWIRNTLSVWFFKKTAYKDWDTVR